MLLSIFLSIVGFAHRLIRLFPLSCHVHLLSSVVVSPSPEPSNLERALHGWSVLLGHDGINSDPEASWKCVTTQRWPSFLSVLIFLIISGRLAVSASSHLSQPGVSSRFIQCPWQGPSFSDGRCGPWRALCPCPHRSLGAWEPVGPSHGFVFCSTSDSRFCRPLEGDHGHFCVCFTSVIGICCSRGYTLKADHGLPSWLVPKPDLKSNNFKVVWCYPNIRLSQQCSSVPFQSLLPSVFTIRESKAIFFQWIKPWSTSWKINSGNVIRKRHLSSFSKP